MPTASSSENSVQMLIPTVSSGMPGVKGGKLRALAVTSAERSKMLPDVPTVAESGYAGFDAPAWWAVLAPAKTPPDIVKRMNDEINKALKQPDLLARFDESGIAAIGGTPEELRSFYQQEYGRFAELVKNAGIVPVSHAVAEVLRVNRFSRS